MINSFGKKLTPAYSIIIKFHLSNMFIKYYLKNPPTLFLHVCLVVELALLSTCKIQDFLID